MTDSLISRLVSRYVLWIGAGLILLVNAIILAGAAYNRSGETSRMQLTQRELRTAWVSNLAQEDSAQALELNWRVMPANGEDADDTDHDSFYSAQANWLNPARLRELGFDIGDTPPPRSEDKRPFNESVRQVWLVLEFDGSVHAATVARALQDLHTQEHADLPDKTRIERIEAARDHWLRERDERSRLYVVDAGLDPRALRQRYPSRSHHLIVGGQVGVDVRALGRKAGKPNQLGYVATIRALNVERIHVPARFHGSTRLGEDKNATYQVTLAWGKRQEPWVVAVQRQ